MTGPAARFRPVTLSLSRSPGTAALALGGDGGPPPRGQEGRRLKAEAESGGGCPASSPGSSAGTGGGKGHVGQSRGGGREDGQRLSSLLCT